MNAYVWIDTEPSTCHERIQIRAREGEDGISHEYLQNLDKVHHEWLNHSEVAVYRSQSVDDIRAYIRSLDK